MLNNVTNWRKADWISMRADLAGVNWKRDFEGKTAYEMWSVFKAKIEASVTKNVPVKKQRNCKRPAWMNKDIKAAINKKKRLWKKAKQGSGLDEYRTADKKVKNMIRAAKRNFEKRLAYEKGGNSRPFYAYVKKKTKSRSTIGPLKDSENKTVSEDRGMAELLNKFFSPYLQEKISETSLQRKQWMRQIWKL